jgi:ketosteroid isomerase-like protein
VPSENVEIARRAFESISRNPGDLSPIRDLLDPDVEFHPAEITPDSAPLSGRDAVIDRLETLVAEFGSVTLEPREFIEVDDEKLVVVLNVRGRGRASGAETEMTLAYVLRGRDGRALSMHAFFDRDEALAAATSS